MKIGEVKINLETVGNKCDKRGIYAVEGEIKKRTIYAENEGEIAVLQADGFLRMDLDDIPAFITELQEIYKDCRFRQREKLKLDVPKREYCRCKEVSGELLDAFKAGLTNREIEEKLGLKRSYVSQKRFRFKEAGLL